VSPEEAAYQVMLEVSETLSECGEFVVIGGWVPELHFPNRGHAGSIDVDVVLSPDKFAIQINLQDHLQKNGYVRSEKLTPTRYLRSVPGLKDDVAVDLLTTPFHLGKRVNEVDIGGIKVGSLPGLDLALLCHDLVEMQGEDTTGRVRRVSVKVARPEAFVLIKAFPLDRRKKAKDAYDIAFILQYYQPSLRHLAARMAPLVETDSGAESYDLLRKHFNRLDSDGPSKAAEFARELGQDFSQMRQAAYQDAQDLFHALTIARGEF